MVKCSDTATTDKRVLMGDWNQLDFVRRHRDLFHPPVLEVGSRDYGNTQDLRALLGETDYVGVDLVEGPGVDVVVDMASDFATVDKALGERRFRTVFCLSVLEHCRDPFAMCANLTRLMAPEAILYLSVPHVWDIHDYPDDYWRFTPQAVRVLFPDLEFPPQWSEAAMAKPGLRLPLPEQPGLVWFTPTYHLQQGRPGHALAVILGKWLLGSRVIFASTMLNMMGRKAADKT